MDSDHAGIPIERRTFLEGGSLVLTTCLLGQSWREQLPVEGFRLGLITDLHYADKTPAGTRHYRETLRKLEEAADAFAQEGATTLVELGDFIDAADSPETELGYLKTVNEKFSAICQDRHYVLGNHCVDTLKKEEFLEAVQQERSFGSCDRNGVHLVFLDACFRSDGQPYQRRNFQWTDANISAPQLEWLRADLQANDKPTLVFVHQRLDVDNHYGIRNQAEVRRILEDSGKVLAVFQGHSHRNDLRSLGGIPYCTLVAMVEGSGAENNGYSLVELDKQGTLKLRGFRQQKSYRWGAGGGRGESPDGAGSSG